MPDMAVYGEDVILPTPWLRIHPDPWKSEFGDPTVAVASTDKKAEIVDPNTIIALLMLPT